MPKETKKTTQEKPQVKNIYHRLHQVRGSVPYIEKAIKGKQLNYSYTPASQVLALFHKPIQEAGLLLKPSIREYSEELVSMPSKYNKDRHQYKVNLAIEFAWINIDNPDEIVSELWYQFSFDDMEKAIGKAFSYAQKYFLINFFNLSCPEDDPDVLFNIPENLGKEQPSPQPKINQPKPQEDKKLIKARGYFKEQVAAAKTSKEVVDLRTRFFTAFPGAKQDEGLIKLAEEKIAALDLPLDMELADVLSTLASFRTLEDLDEFLPGCSQYQNDPDFIEVVANARKALGGKTNNELMEQALAASKGIEG